jgi:hypothetical protein
LARLVARDPKDVPHHRASWLGPDTALLEAALRECIENAQAHRLGRRPEVDELARHHAFDMAARNFLTDTDPEGVDHSERRRRLHPNLVGRSHQFIDDFTPDAGQSPDAFAAHLWERLSVSVDPVAAATRWDDLGVGVAIERGRGRVCVILGQTWAELSTQASWGPDSGWEVEGRTVSGTRREQLSVRLLRGESPGGEEAAEHDIGWDDDRFRLQIDATDPNDHTWVEIARDGIPGLRRRIR